ncbi:MAG: poly-gamma-glutamate hydrolase family protein [Anaerolineales bacterium]|jgi:phage replication-related protein YjqB (UPF0714/DUF867 family)
MPKDDLQPYNDFNQIARHEREGIDYRRQRVWSASPVLIAAPHGGGIEPGTSEVAIALAGEAHALYLFEGFKGDQNQYLHVASTRFNDPWLDELLQKAQYVAAVHGCRGSQAVTYIGGQHERWRELAIQMLSQAGFSAERDEGHHAGRHPSNLCNRGRSGMGVQFELSLGLRRQMFANLSRPGRESPTPVFHRFASALQPLWTNL